MNPLDSFDEDGTPRAEVWRRQHAERNFVAPMPPVLATRPVTIDQAPQWLTPAQPVDLAQAWQPAQGARENTSAMDRARALRVRLVPFVLLWALLALIVFVVVLLVAQNAPGAALGGLLAFTALTAYTYYRLNRTDYDYSREGTERHKVDTAAYLAERELDHRARMQEKALDAYLQTLERHQEGKR